MRTARLEDVDGVGTRLRRIGRAGVLVALLLVFVAAGSASAGSDPVLGDTTPNVAASLPPFLPVHHLRIRAVLTANDDGSHAATITPAEIQTLVDAANQIWAGGGFVFDFNPVYDMETRNDTLLNNDCSVVWSFSGGFPQATCDVQPNVEERERVALDDQHDNRITIYFRYGNSTLECSSLLSCTNKQATGAYSSTAGHFVVFVSGSAGSTALAHELGHYLWNAHTFGPAPATYAEAAQDIDNYVEGKAGYTPHPVGEGANVFDGDAARVSDTPPDPGSTLWQALKGDACANARGDGSTTITVDLPSGPHDYLLQPDRTNIMSYFKGCTTLPHTTSPQQRARALYAIEHGNRNQLVCGCPAHFAQFDSVWSSVYPPGATTIEPFLLGGRPHLFVYRDQGGKLNIERLGDSGKGLTTLSSGWLWNDSSPHWTAFAPFTVSGAPFFVAYDSSSGAVKTIRVTSSGGIDTLWSSNWPTGFTGLLPFVQGGQQFVLGYNATTGDVDIERLGADGTGSTNVWSGLWQSGYTSFVPLVLNGQPWTLAYSSGAGTATLWRFNAGGLGAQAMWVVWLGKGLTSFAALDRGAQQRFVAYNPATGSWLADRVAPNGTSVTPLDATWQPGFGSWSAIVAVREPGLWYLFAYGGGIVQTWSILQ